jgi:hypothetical protein
MMTRLTITSSVVRKPMVWSTLPMFAATTSVPGAVSSWLSIW